jgi:hypothetical protein
MPEYNLLGDEILLYEDTAARTDGVWNATPSWQLQEDFSDISFNAGRKHIEIPKRRYVQHRFGRKEWALSFTLNVSPGDAFYARVIAAIRSGDPLHLAICTQPIATSGLIYDHADFILTGPIDGSLDNPATIPIEAHVDAASPNEPTTTTVS